MPRRLLALTCIAAAVRLTVGVGSALGMPLEERIPRLFGGTLATFISPRGGRDAQRPRVADRFRGLSASLAAARSQAPIPALTGAFSYAWNDESDVYIRTTYSLGPSLAERAQTLGRGLLTVAASYTHADYDTFEGTSLRRVRAAQPALTPSFVARLPVEAERLRVDDDRLVTELALDFAFDSVFVGVGYGITDTIDVGLALSINSARMEASASAQIRDREGDGAAFFTVDQPGAIVGGSGAICGTDFRCATDSFEDSATGTGDIFLRAKWHAYRWQTVDFGVAGVLTLPTGNADELLGFHDPTFTPWLIGSATFGRFSPHVNAGYSVRSTADVSQAVWVAGADLRAFDWMALATDFLGFHDTERDEINDDVYQVALGAKVNVFRRAVVSGNVQLPLNRDGLRANVVYTVQAEYTF